MVCIENDINRIRHPCTQPLKRFCIQCQIPIRNDWTFIFSWGMRFKTLPAKLKSAYDMNFLHAYLCCNINKHAWMSMRYMFASKDT